MTGNATLISEASLFQQRLTSLCFVAWLYSSAAVLWHKGKTFLLRIKWQQNQNKMPVTSGVLLVPPKLSPKHSGKLLVKHKILVCRSCIIYGGCMYIYCIYGITASKCFVLSQFESWSFLNKPLPILYCSFLCYLPTSMYSSMLYYHNGKSQE